MNLGRKMIFDNRYKLEEKIDFDKHYSTHKVFDLRNGDFKALQLIQLNELNQKPLENIRQKCAKLLNKWNPNVVEYQLEFFEKGFYCLLTEYCSVNLDMNFF